MQEQDKFAKWVFIVAGIYGVLALLPQYFLEQKNGMQFPPPINHPEHFYGFVGVALAWQIAFFIIARDVPRYRMLMLPAALEKILFGGAVLVLYTQQRVVAFTLVPAVIDFLFATLFLIAFKRCRQG